MEQRTYTLIDLFAGCGGLSLGLEQADFTPVFVSELHNDALSTYLMNRSHSLGGMRFSENKRLHCNDANELDKKRLDELWSDLKTLKELDITFDATVDVKTGGGSNIDLIAGGPPCQGYSGIGIRRSYSVDRKEIPSNHLFGRMANIIKEARPRMFLFENVRGLLNAKWAKNTTERVWDSVKAEFRSIPGYEVRWSLVYAKDYGVPQNRPRVLLVGIRKDIVEKSALIDLKADPEDAVKCGFLPAGESQSYPDLGDLLGDLVDPEVMNVLRTGEFPAGRFETKSYPSSAKHPIQKALRHNPNSNQTTKLTEQEYSKHKLAVVAKFDYMLKNNGEIPAEFKTKKFSQRVLKRAWDNRGPNITATSLPDDYVHFSQPRILTVREWARLQLFPDWYLFSGKRTTGGIRRAGNPQQGLYDREVPKYTQIGNAVPVGLAQKVGLHFRSILDGVLENNAGEKRHECEPNAESV